MLVFPQPSGMLFFYFNFVWFNVICYRSGSVQHIFLNRVNNTISVVGTIYSDFNNYFDINFEINYKIYNEARIVDFIFNSTIRQRFC